MVRIACVLRRSHEYDAEYVERLRDGTSHLGIPFVCLSDSEVPCERIPLKYFWPGWWSKMELFRPDVKGDLLYFDLDTVIKGDLKDFLVGRLTMLSDFNVLDRVASGVMYLPEDSRAEVWDHWIKDPEAGMASSHEGDQGYLSHHYSKKAARWQNLIPGQIVSYKLHVKTGTQGNNVRAVCFHGKPRPRDVNW
jgi:hypothetical protein